MLFQVKQFHSMDVGVDIHFEIAICFWKNSQMANISTEISSGLFCILLD